ncbi:MAG: hypothetical protein ACOX2F_12640 [bacterium]
MRNILIILLLLSFWSCTSCNSGETKTDIDVSPDIDSVAVIDSDTHDLEMESDDVPDADAVAECFPSLIDAPFPYYDEKGNITFCRPGCNEATEKDPQCMSNLWKEQNQALCTQMPQYDCCGYPCVMESFKPMTKEETDKELVFEGNILVPMHKCDLSISLIGWGHDGTVGVVKSWNMSEGKIGFYLSPSKPLIKDWPVKLKYVSYDIETKYYHFITPARGQEQAYYKGKRIGLISDKRSLDLNNSNIFMAYISDDGKMELIYNKKVKHLPYEPALNDKWAFANISEPGSKKMSYAKVGEWKWTVLGEGYGWEPGIAGNTLVLVDDDVNGWVCDLSKNPQKISDCMKVNRGNEKVRGIRINKKDETKFVYNSNITKLVYLELKEGSFVYNDLITDFTDETIKNAYSLAALEYKDKILLFEEIVSDGSSYGGLLCYYRIDKKKKYCMKKMENDKEFADGTTQYPYGFSEFEGKWLLYQKKNSTPLILRDMECYCKEEGICPFEE